MKSRKGNHFHLIVGEQLSAVIFVQDYLQLDFDGNKFTLNVWPEVNINGRISNYNQAAYRNELCSLLTNIVKQIEIIEQESFSITFKDGSFIKLSLNYDAVDVVGEIVVFEDNEENWSYL